MSPIEKGLLVIAVGAVGYFAYTKFAARPGAVQNNNASDQGGVGAGGTSKPSGGKKSVLERVAAGSASVGQVVKGVDDLISIFGG